MKIAVTADVHIKTLDETPERYVALESIFKEIQQKGIKYLLIAGDTFDKESSNYYDFNSLCERYKDIQVIVIPGNHDPEIEKRFFSGDNIEIINEPLIKKINGLAVLFIPYIPLKTLDEVLTEYIHNKNLPERWVLIGHGDYITANRQMNSYEPGFYMPISSKTINKFNPIKVILGHIHKPSEYGKVFYPGSPCGLDITETGKRKFILYDTRTDIIERQSIQTGVIYIIETVLTFPFESETDLLRNKIDYMIEKWNLTAKELNRVKLRLKIIGYTRNLPNIKDFLIKYLEERHITLYDLDAPDLSSVLVMKDIDEEKISIFNKVKERVENLYLQNFGVSKDKILDRTMEIIFGD